MASSAGAGALSAASTMAWVQPSGIRLRRGGGVRRCERARRCEEVHSGIRVRRGEDGGRRSKSDDAGWHTHLQPALELL